MKPRPFDYMRPDTVEEAVAILAEHGDDARVLAGGQTLLAMLNLRVVEAAMLVDITRISELDSIREVDGKIEVAAAVTQRRRVRFENHGRIGSAVPRPVNLVARNAHDVAGFAAIAPSVDEEKDLSGHDIVHLLAVVPVRACVIARGAFSEHETGIGSINLLRS